MTYAASVSRIEYRTTRDDGTIVTDPAEKLEIAVFGGGKTEQIEIIVRMLEGRTKKAVIEAFWQDFGAGYDLRWA